MAPPTKSNPLPLFGTYSPEGGQRQNPLPPSGVSPLSGGQRQQTSPDKGGSRGISIPDREARRPRRGRAFCPPDKGGSRGVFIPDREAGGLPQKQPLPLFGTYSPEGGQRQNPLPPSGGSPLSGGQRQQTSLTRGDQGGFPFPIGKQGDPEGGELFAPLIRGDQGGFSSR